MPTEDKLWLPPLSPKDQKKLDHLQKDRKKAKQPLIAVGISAAFIGLIVLIYVWFRLNWPLWVIIALLPIGIVLLILLIRVGYTAQWTGFSGKTVWEWLPLIIQLLAAIAIPVAIAVGTTWFSYQQNQISLQIALDQQRETTLKTSMDGIKDLLLNNRLRTSKPGDEVRVVARTEVLAALQQLDGRRKGLLVQFLSEAELVTGVGSKAGMDDVIISLKGADLSGANLLMGSDLSHADLGSADLSGAELKGVDLSFANLKYATLKEAFLQYANLSKAILWGADLSNSDLSDADLSGADLGYTHLSGADVMGADLTGVYLDNADRTLHDLLVASQRHIGICSGNTCNGLNPVTTGCADSAYTMQTAVFKDSFLELRYSPKCGTAWGRVKSRIGPAYLVIRIERNDGLIYTLSGGNFSTAWSAMVFAPLIAVRACGGVKSIRGCTN